MVLVKVVSAISELVSAWFGSGENGASSEWFW